MNLEEYPIEAGIYISELIKRKAVSDISLDDKMFINYLSSLRLDEYYIKDLKDDLLRDRKDHNLS
ncbi:hypothetical protein [Petroclostridium sp. X23]|uniref:hypothetical protein n=1 Tax=Petroclostridium sp. X23 TaxID=3045146 RepID=UPI0024AD0F33|nr:hypothetical protein [Petroclostridium sp. X23]WHH60050.1 hypothetical protein QKW49_04710 [Petroclostridium sp. X23]